MTHDDVEMIVDGIHRLTDAVLTVAIVVLFTDPTMSRTDKQAKAEAIRLWEEIR